MTLGNNLFDGSRAKGDLIFADDTRGAADMTRYLVSLGHTHIWFVGNTRLPWFARCFAGYSRVMEEAGLAVRHSSIDSEDDSEVGYLRTKSLLSRAEPVTAIFAGNDSTAHGVYKALRDSGLRVPDDISVAGCDDTVGEWLFPGLTTIREFPEHLGKQMVELILRRIEDPSLEAEHYFANRIDQAGLVPSNFSDARSGARQGIASGASVRLALAVAMNG